VIGNSFVIAVPTVLFFVVAGFLMDLQFSNSLLADTFFANSAFHATQQLQGALGTSAIGYVVGCLIFGPLSERSGRRSMAVACLTLLILVYYLLMHCTSPRMLFMLMLAKRFVTAMYWPALMAWLTEMSLPQNLGRNLCVFNVGWCAGCIAGDWLPGHFGRWMATTPGTYNAPATYALSAGFCVILAVWLLLMNPRKPHEQPIELQHPTPANTKLFLMQGWVAHLAACASVALTLYMLPRLAAMPHLRITEAGMSDLHAVRMAVMLLVFLSLYFTSIWHFHFYPAYSALLVSAGGLLLIGLAPAPTFVMIGQVGLGLAMGMAYTISQYYSLMLPRTKGKGSAIHETMVGLAYVIGPALGGVTNHINADPRLPFLAGLAPIVLALLAVSIMRMRVRHEPIITSESRPCVLTER